MNLARRMTENPSAINPIRWENDTLVLLDQRYLPALTLLQSGCISVTGEYEVRQELIKISFSILADSSSRKVTLSLILPMHESKSL